MVHSETTARFKPLGWGVAVGRECIPFHGQYGSYTLEFLSSTQLKKECLGERPHLQCREMWRLQRPFVQASQCTGAADCSHLYYMCSRVTAFILVGQVEQESGLFPSGHIRRLHYHVPPPPPFLRLCSLQKVHLGYYNILLRQYEQVKRLIKIQCKSWSVGLSKKASVSGRWNCSVPEQGLALDWHEEGICASGKVVAQCRMSGWAKKPSLWEGRGWRWADEEGQRLNEWRGHSHWILIN